MHMMNKELPHIFASTMPLRQHQLQTEGEAKNRKFTGKTMQNSGKIIHLEWNKCQHILRYFDDYDTLTAFPFFSLTCHLKNHLISHRSQLLKGLTLANRETFGKFKMITMNTSNIRMKNYSHSIQRYKTMINDRVIGFAMGHS